MPSTDFGVATSYDSLATAYDRLNPTPAEMARTIRDVVASLSGDFPPALLDVGCGTGRVLDLGITTPDRYAGVDPSQPMLNQLVRKHPGVGAVYPMRIEEALSKRLFTPGQFEIVTALLHDEERVGDDVVPELAEIASRGLIVARGDDVTVIDTRRAVEPRSG